MDGVLNEASPTRLRHVGAPLRRVVASYGEELVVTEDGRHGLAQGPALHEVAQSPKDGSAAQHQPALAGHTGGVCRPG